MSNGVSLLSLSRFSLSRPCSRALGDVVQLSDPKFVYCCGEISAAIPFVPNPGLCFVFSCVDIRTVLPELENELNKTGTWTSPWVLFARESEVYAGGFSGPKVAATTTGFTLPQKDYSGALAWRRCESVGPLGDPCVFLDPASFNVDGQVCNGTFSVQNGANGSPRPQGSFTIPKIQPPPFLPMPTPKPTRPTGRPSVAPTLDQTLTTTTTTTPPTTPPTPPPATTTTPTTKSTNADEFEADTDGDNTVIVVVVSVVGALVVIGLLGVIFFVWKSLADADADDRVEPSSYDVVPAQTDAAVGTTYDDASALE